jgi:hypothetical protein
MLKDWGLGSIWLKTLVIGHTELGHFVAETMVNQYKDRITILDDQEIEDLYGCRS